MPAITDVRINLLRDEGKLKAFASITLDDACAVHGLRVLEGENGLFVAMPSRKIDDDEYRDVFHPVTKEFREQLLAAVLEAYEDELSIEDFRGKRKAERKARAGA